MLEVVLFLAGVYKAFRKRCPRGLAANSLGFLFAGLISFHGGPVRES